MASNIVKAVSNVSNIKEAPLPILLIGGTDPSGAGLQVDWKVANTLGIEANTVVTAVTAQNSESVLDSGVLPSQQFKAQFEAVKSQSFSAIKIGMLGNEAIVQEMVTFLTSLSETTDELSIIVDPVLRASSGGSLLNEAGIKCLLSKLLPLTTLITPNLDELALLTRLPVTTQTEIQAAAKQLLTEGAKAVLVKGGHGNDQRHSTDLFMDGTHRFYLHGERWKGRTNVRGTGCALATGITAMLSKGYCLRDAIVLSKTMLSQGIRQAINTGGQTKLRFQQNEKNSVSELQDFPELSHSFTQSQPDFLRCDSKSLGLYPVVDSVEWIKKLVPLGIETIQLRIKTDASTNSDRIDSVEQQIQEAIVFCKQSNVRLFINDHWRIAIKHNAYGIHLGQEDLAKLKDDDLQNIAKAKCRLGISTHSFYEVARAHALKPSYIALGPIFATTSKDMPWIPQGVSAVKMWVELFGGEYPLVAIGGINFERATALREAGVGSIAMITAITEAQDYKKATKELLTLWDKKQ